MREAARRAVGLRHYDSQLLGGMALFDGGVAEMQTGEGKTLVATLPLVLRGLVRKGALLATANDYLAARDAEWMGPVYRLLGLTVGVVSAETPPAERRAAYACDVTYGTAREFGFDFLRDRLASQCVREFQRQPVCHGWNSRTQSGFTQLRHPLGRVRAALYLCWWTRRTAC